MVNASLAYEILMYLNSFYFGMFAACELGIGVLKAINLQYTQSVLIRESCLLVVLCLLETIRIVLGRRGSLSDRGWQVLTSVVLSLPCACGVGYFLIFQTYILRLEYILCALMLALHTTEIVFSVMFICTLCRPVTYT
ncbi:transmembrane protein 216-like [Hermetia illucens]|uniref:transmembrane protein 216-like n=1 Tax=Hermetia illucens TaxID=343691 RepID=UPI0018CC02CB|nr:transmembrane protein 216-like [Hermetia illucens]